jgi:hypothetical protein
LLSFFLSCLVWELQCSQLEHLRTSFRVSTLLVHALASRITISQHASRPSTLWWNFRYEIKKAVS